MSDATSRLNVIISAIDHASPTLGKVAKAMNSQGVQAGIAAGITTKAMGLAGMAIHKVVAFIEDSVAAYREQEVAAARLATSLNANVKGWQGSTEAIKDATEASVNLGFTDNETTDAMARLVAATHNVGEATKILATAQDLARFKGISLSDATDALTKVEAGSFRILKSLGIQLKAGATQTEALAAVTKLAGGQARAFANTDLGQVTIASAKAEEAQEKFGKVLSKIGTVVVPIVADALTGVATAIDNIFVQMDQNASEVDKLTARIDALSASGMANDPPMKAMILNLKDQRTALLDSQAAAATHGDELDGLRSSVRGVTDAELAALSPTEDFKQDLDKVASASDLAKDAIKGLSDTISDQLYGRAITKGNEARFKENIKDLKDQRSEVKEGSLKWIELTGEIAENRKGLFDLHLTQAADKGPKAAIAFLQAQIDKSGDASGALHKLIGKYQDLIEIQGAAWKAAQKVYGGKITKLPVFGAGGFAAPGQAAIVGEKGPEIIVPHGAGVDVIPQAQWGRGGVNYGGGGSSGGGTPVEIPLILDGREIGRIVDSRLYYAFGSAGGNRAPR